MSAKWISSLQFALRHLTEELNGVALQRGPAVLPPWRWKVGLLLSKHGHNVVETSGSGNSFSVRTCSALSTTGLTSHRIAKNLCERDALSTELYPRKPPIIPSQEI